MICSYQNRFLTSRLLAALHSKPLSYSNEGGRRSVLLSPVVVAENMKDETVREVRVIFDMVQMGRDFGANDSKQFNYAIGVIDGAHEVAHSYLYFRLALDLPSRASA